MSFTVYDEGRETWLDGIRAQYTIVNEHGAAFAYVFDGGLAQLFATAPETAAALAAMTARAEAAEAKLAAVPVKSIDVVLRGMDDVPWDDDAYDAVVAWLGGVR